MKFNPYFVKVIRVYFIYRNVKLHFLVFKVIKLGKVFKIRIKIRSLVILVGRYSECLVPRKLP